MTPTQVMSLVDAHVRASLEKFAGSKRDTEATRAAVEAAIARLGAAPVPTLTMEVREMQPPVPSVKPPSAKKARIFGG